MAYELPAKGSKESKESAKALGFLNGNLATKNGGSRKIMLGVMTGDKQQDIEFHQWMVKGSDEDRLKKLEYVKANLTLTYNPNEPAAGSFFELPDNL
jgi:hypothetical protein